MPFNHERPTGVRRPLLTAFYDPAEPVRAAGSRILLSHGESKAIQFDAEPMAEERRRPGPSDRLGRCGSRFRAATAARLPI